MNRRLWSIGRFAFTFLLFSSALSLQAEEKSPAESKKQRFAKIIQQVREHEKRYQNLETVIRRTITIPEKHTTGWKFSKSEETYRTVQQGDLLYLAGEDVKHLLTGDKVTFRRLSAYDGEKTTSIEYGNSVNIHERRYEPSQLFPPHCWGMFHLEINFPLSVLLEGTTAMKKHPKVRRLPAEGVSIFAFNKVECQFEKEEVVGDLNCLKIRCKRWYDTKDPPLIHFLWLAPERNYLCVKTKSLFRNGDENFPSGESVVEEFKEIAPGLWLPGKVVVKEYDYKAAGQQKREVRTTRSQNLQQATLKPQHPLTLFTNVEIPKDLPLFTIRKDGHLKNGPLTKQRKQPDKEALKKLLQKIRVEEGGYENLEVSMETDYRVQSLGEPGQHMTSKSLERSVLIDEEAFYSEEKTIQSLSGFASDGGFVEREKPKPVVHQIRLSHTRQAYDCLWLRILIRSTYIKPKREESINASLYRVRIEKRLHVIRPHSLLLRNLSIYQRLSDVLKSEQWAQGSGSPLSVEYEGEETIDNLKCHKLRLVVFRGNPPRPTRPIYIMYLWLAEERNFIPVRQEFYELRRSEKLPTAISAVTQWKEIDSGIWFPAQASLFVCNSTRGEGLCENRLILNYRYDYKIRNVKLEPTVDLKLFHEITVPQGTSVTVFNENGKRTRYKQEKTGNLNPPEDE